MEIRLVVVFYIEQKKLHSIRAQNRKVMDFQGGCNTALIFSALGGINTPRNGPQRKVLITRMHLRWNMACVGVVELLLL